MREKILNLLEKNARIDIHDMAVMLGVAEHEVANEIAVYHLYERPRSVK